MENNDFISKEFECRNSIVSDNKTVNSIVDFFRTIEDKIEIENKNGKRVNAKSFIKMMGLDIKYGYKFTLYVYGADRENNLKRIEEVLEKKEFYTLEKIEELEKEQESEGNKYIEEEILFLTPDDKKDIIKEDIENKIKILKEKRDSLHLPSLNLDNNIIYVKNDDKTEIVNVINNNISDVIRKLSSHYEVNINENDLSNFLYKLIDIAKDREMKYFYIHLFFNNVKKYFYNQFDLLFIKKIIGIEPLNVQYDIETNKNFIDESIKTLDFILEDKRKSSDYSINIYMISNTSNFSLDLYRTINIVQNIGKIYEIEEKIIDNIAYKIKDNFEHKNKINTSHNNEEYWETIREFKEYLQNKFETIYINKVLEKDSEDSVIDYQHINIMVRRL
ncbi:HPr family phosphocarrier protein [Brachyspira hyodysenteriae]|uniref:HPr family phosphocarrier protein n=1 Tax=Brachyspira hyodysenteriae TaxID=159 RepID=UPI00063D8F91|nr:HPr family phosphocarrier protein [Brachyspira hyodysenteriae]KLI50173.1 phosphocarrier protein HPr [Brachyspira hyodysenteriae]MCZ9955489.1 HPr family phosphocarrier protein [Brachyspira hyodysenteriae]MCZ9980626.1 HPr family phosphocarrier protein [Brachyspira hyodysenteriae]MDA0034223.1 HPr family phosphocarrier protein [Brachyspira hyodysenteriae]MDA0048296.1 HPr family phosphocarrier protein [Brachyspira hyodysenteriae]